MTRKFQVAKDFNEKDVIMPCRSTKFSAGYDMFASEDVVIEPLKEVTMVQTGVSAQMEDDEVLKVYIRSSLASKGLMLANNVGIIDKDYCPNPIGVMLINVSSEPYHIKKGDKIVQGIFEKYLTTDDDSDTLRDVERKGGYGSTGDK